MIRLIGVVQTWIRLYAGRISFKDSLINSIHGVEGENFVGGLPTIKFSKTVHELMEQSMMRIVVLKLLGRRIEFNTLLNKLYLIGKPKGQFQLMYLENDYFLVKFKCEEDFTFATSQPYPLNVVTWVRLHPCTRRVR